VTKPRSLDRPGDCAAIGPVHVRACPKGYFLPRFDMQEVAAVKRRRKPNGYGSDCANLSLMHL
jgi:hypothetical protein